MLGVVMDDGQVDGMRQRGFAARRVVMPVTGTVSWTVIFVGGVI